jgi:hypothetical protein
VRVVTATIVVNGVLVGIEVAEVVVAHIAISRDG